MADKPNYITLAHLRTAISALLNKVDTKPNEEDFSNVAFSGDYSDLTNRPDLSAYVNWITYSELTDYVSSVASVNGILKCDGDGSITAAIAGTDYQAPLPSTNGNNGKFLSIDNGNLAWSSLGSIFTYKGTKTDIASLPSSGNTIGDVWIVTADNSEHVWNGSAWEELGPTTDLSIYMRKGVDYVTAGRKANTTAGNGTTAEGNNNTVIGPYSHAEGSSNTIQTQGNNAHAEGTGNLVTKASGHAEGENVQVTGVAAHAEGSGTTASGNGSHAEGYSTLAGAQNAHAEGRITSATGAQSHAEGFRAVASGDNAHAEGYYTTAQRKSQHVFGEYNILDTTGTGTTRGDYVEIVGNGTSTSDRSNARTLDWNGNEILAGKLTVGAGPTANMDAATKQYVDTAVGNAASITMVDHSGPTTTQLNSLTINKLTQAQYNAISNPDPNQLYMITDDTIYATKTYVDTAISNIDALPSQSGNSGKFLTTNGSVASWANVESEIFLITATTSNGTITANKTYTEILAAYNAGKICVVNFDNSHICPLMYISTTGASFCKTATTSDGAYQRDVSVTNANVWNTTVVPLQTKTTASGILKGNGSGGVTAAVAGTDYAAASHNHSASNITSGTLGIARGGTGGTTAQDATWNLLHVADPGNLNNAKRMGNFKISNTTTNTPVANMWGATWNIVDDSAAGNNGSSGTTWQLVFQSASTDMWLRTITNAGGWSAYKRVWTEGNAVTGAVWNDYAEYRETDTLEFGRCVSEVGDDTLTLTTKRLQKGCAITSDTWGFAQGKTEKAQTPIAVAGRVLAYPFEDKEEFRKHIGDAVCSGPEGTVSIMTDEEVQKYPLSIIGTISAVPDYEEWGGGSDRDPVKVNGRVWIRIK